MKNMYIDSSLLRNVFWAPNQCGVIATQNSGLLSQELNTLIKNIISEDINL